MPQMIYSDSDGADDLSTLHLKITNPSTNDIEYYAVDGVDGSGLIPTAVSGSSYIRSVTYDRDASAPTANDITITWHITFDWDWDWDEDTLIEYGVKAIDDSVADSGWAYTIGDFNYDNDLTFTGGLSVTGQWQGVLSSGDWVRASEGIDWTGQKVVFQGTTTVYPLDSDFDVQLADDDTGVWTDTTSSGEKFAISSTADATTDAANLHTLSIINIPTGGLDVSSSTFTVRVDADDSTDGSVIVNDDDIYN